MKFAAKKWLTAIACVLLLNACATSPTGRSQLLLFPDSELASMGQQAFTGMKSQIKISNTAVENRLVQCITKELLQHVDNSVYGGEWELIVFDDDQVNAFALPGGKIGVYTGLLKVAVNQHQIAAVVGHEIGHVIAKHGNERMSNNALIGIGQQATGQILAANEVAQTPEIMMALGVGLQFGALKYSRIHESEADEIGLTLMAKAGFKPSESVTLWQNMAAQSAGNRQPEFMSTHPAPDTRIENLNKQMPQAEKLFRATLNRPSCGGSLKPMANNKNPH
jgi:predicted Zn-dependent protease